jgi:hypothetical protein
MEDVMQYVLLVYQGTNWARLPDLSEDDRKSLGAEYAAINNSPGVTPGLPLGFPEKATTVRVNDGERLTTEGPFVNAEGAAAGYYVLEADDLDAAIEVASRIPAARLGGAVEVRPVETYW